MIWKWDRAASRFNWKTPTGTPSSYSNQAEDPDVVSKKSAKVAKKAAQAGICEGGQTAQGGCHVICP